MSTEFDGFEDIGNNIYLYEPSTSAPTPESNSTDASVESTTSAASNNAPSTSTPVPNPTLIILCTWMGGATPRRIKKYITIHRTLFPHSAILLIRAFVSENTYLSASVQRPRLRPAHDAITRILSSSSTQTETHQPPPSILLHAMSNGGASTVLQLIHSLNEAALPRKEGQNPLPLPLRGLILDCAPAEASFKTLLTSARASLPSSALRPLYLAALFPILGLIPVIQPAKYYKRVSDLRRELNDTTVINAGCRRLYIFSEADEVVDTESVCRHGDDAVQRGYDVAMVRFENGEHCALALESGNKERYVRGLREWWEESEDAWRDVGRLDHGVRAPGLKAKL